MVRALKLEQSLELIMMSDLYRSCLPCTVLRRDYTTRESRILSLPLPELESVRVFAQVPDLAAGLPKEGELPSQPLQGIRVGLIEETLGEGVSADVRDTVEKAAQHMEGLGASVGRVSMASFASGLPAYYVIASSEASSNLARCANGAAMRSVCCCWRIALPRTWLHAISVPAHHQVLTPYWCELLPTR